MVREAAATGYFLDELGAVLGHSALSHPRGFEPGGSPAAGRP